MKKINRTVNGDVVKTAWVFRGKDHWRWQIITIAGREYVDSGNYLTEDAAKRGLEDAYDRQ